jgi:hypothetical protein
MANKGWDGSSGPGLPSDSRTTGGNTSTGNADAMASMSKIAAPGDMNDPLDARSDYHPGAAGQLSPTQ